MSDVIDAYAGAFRGAIVRRNRRRRIATAGMTMAAACAAIVLTLSLGGPEPEREAVMAAPSPVIAAVDGDSRPVDLSRRWVRALGRVAPAGAAIDFDAAVRITAPPLIAPELDGFRVGGGWNWVVAPGVGQFVAALGGIPVPATYDAFESGGMKAYLLKPEAVFTYGLVPEGYVRVRALDGEGDVLARGPIVRNAYRIAVPGPDRPLIELERADGTWLRP